MRVSEKRRVGHLQLNKLTTRLGLAQLLPPEVAFRYHALPVAEQDGCITVAMANPDDSEAREVIATALGTAAFMVGGDSEAIDTLLAEIWPELSPATSHLLVYNNPLDCDESAEPVDQVWDFAVALSDLLESRHSYFDPGAPLSDSEQAIRALLAEVARIGCNLVIIPATVHSPFRWLTFGSIERRIVETIPTSVLVVRKPRWPLKKVLLVARCEETDEAGARWAIRLARASGAHVTILPIMPPLPALYQVGLEELLTPNTVSGSQLRQLARQMEQWDIASTLCVRQGDPDWQIREEATENDYDLIVISAERSGRLQRLLLGELVGPLLSWLDRPVLIAKRGQVTTRTTQNG